MKLSWRWYLSLTVIVLGVWGGLRFLTPPAPEAVSGRSEAGRITPPSADVSPPIADSLPVDEPSLLGADSKRTARDPAYGSRNHRSGAVDPEPAEEDTSVQFEGTVTVGSFEEYGESISGTVILRMERYFKDRPKEQWKKEVKVVDGVFKIRYEPDDWFVAEAGTLDERKVSFAGIGYRIGDREGVLEARFRDQWLEVVDAVTGDHLSGVKVIQMIELEVDPATWHRKPYTAYRLNGILHPSGFLESEVVCSGETSPVDLGIPDKNRLMDLGLVGVEGYGWRSFKPDPRNRPTIRIELRKAAGLSVKVVNAPRGIEAALRLLWPDSRGFENAGVVYEVPLDPRSPELTLADLDPNDIYASVEIGRPGYPGHTVLAKSDLIRMRSGQTSQVTLRCDPAPEIPQRVPLAGTLVVPQGWLVPEEAPWPRDPIDRIARLGFDLRAIDPIADVEGTDLTVALEPSPVRGTFYFDAGSVVPGSFGVHISEPLEWSTRVEVGPAGTQSLRIELPRPSTLRVHVEGVRGEVMIKWCTGPLERSAVPYQSQPEGPPYLLRVPVGPVTVQVSDYVVGDSAYGTIFNSEPRTVDVSAGQNEIRVVLDRSTGVHVMLNERGWVKVEGDAGQQIRGSKSLGNSGTPPWSWQSVTYLDPGRWTITPQRADPELAPVEPTIVDVPEGKVVEVKIDLRGENDR